MRVIELWTNTPMRMGKAGNIVATHLLELLPKFGDDGSPQLQEWRAIPGKLPEMCLSLTMEVDAHGVVVRLESEGGGVERYLVRDIATARLEPYEAARTFDRTEVPVVEPATPKREDEPTVEVALQGGASVPGKSEALRKGVPVPSGLGKGPRR